MTIYYSPGRNGFFDDLLFGPRLIAAPLTAREAKAGKRPRMLPNPECRLPPDAVKISDEEHTRLMDELSTGKQLVVRDGRPVAIDTERDPDEVAAARRRLRDQLLRASDWTQLADTLLDDPGLKAAWAVYRADLRDLDFLADDFAWPDEPAGAIAGPANG